MNSATIISAAPWGTTKPSLPHHPASHLQIGDNPAWELSQQPFLGELMKHHKRQAEEDDDEIPEREAG